MLRNRKYRHPILRGLHGIRVQASDMMVGADLLEADPAHLECRERRLNDPACNMPYSNSVVNPIVFAVIKLQCPIRMELAHNVNLEVA